MKYMRHHDILCISALVLFALCIFMPDFIEFLNTHTLGRAVFVGFIVLFSKIHLLYGLAFTFIIIYTLQYEKGMEAFTPDENDIYESEQYRQHPKEVTNDSIQKEMRHGENGRRMPKFTLLNIPEIKAREPPVIELFSSGHKKKTIFSSLNI